VEKDFNIVTKHAESELAVINMGVGAAFAGVRSMLATSGGGFALMNEGIAAAAMTETPIVIVLCQRPAPATGLPTWSEQGDLMFAAHSAHGEFPRVLIAPGDPEECFYLTGDAFNLAEKYQVPVIILLDKFLSESHFTIDKLRPDKIKIDRGKIFFSSKDLKKSKEDRYLRYQVTDDGISPRTLPGIEGGLHIANTDEHDEYGFSEEGAANRKKMMDKRFAKLKKLSNDIKGPVIYGPEKAEVSIICWGSCKMPVLEAMEYLNSDSDRVNLVHFTYLLPFPEKAFSDAVKNSDKVIIAENNKTSQLSLLIRENTGISINDRIIKYNGRQFLPEDIIEGIKKLIP
jgi:2-oxoglutarate ferredoxin oxidoreductase subunit alpha